MNWIKTVSAGIDRYRVLADILDNAKGITLPKRSVHEHFVASSIQFSLDVEDPNRVIRFIDECGKRGVEIK